MKAAMKEAVRKTEMKDSRIAELEAELGQASASQLLAAEEMVREKAAENAILNEQLELLRTQVCIRASFFKIK